MEMHITEQVKEYVQHAMKNKIRTYFVFYSIVGCGGVNLGVDLQETIHVQNREIGIVLEGYNPDVSC